MEKLLFKTTHFTKNYSNSQGLLCLTETKFQMYFNSHSHIKPANCKRMEDKSVYCIWQGEAKSECRLWQKWHKIEFSMYNISHMTQKVLKWRQPLFWWRMTKGTSALSAPTKYRPNMHNISIQYHSFNPTNKQDHICAELPNIPYIKLFLYTPKVLVAIFFVTALILCVHIL